MQRDSTARQQFADVVARAPSLWRSVDTRVLAVFADGAWRNLVTRSHLRPFSVRKVHRLKFLPQTPYLRAWQAVTPMSEWQAIVDAQERGAMQFGRHKVAFDGAYPPGSAAQPYVFRTFTQLVASNRGITNDFPWPGYVMSASGSQASEIVRSTPGNFAGIDAIIRDLPRPFRSLDEVARYVTGGGYGWTCVGSHALAEWYAPFEARFDLDGTDYRTGMVRYRVVVGARHVAKHAKLFVHAQARSEPSKVSELRAKVELPLASIAIQSNDMHQLAVVGESGPVASHEVTLTLRVGKEPVQWLDLKDYQAQGKNARIAFYETIDPGLRVLRAWLFPKKEDRPKFEAGVARLFMFAGFHVDFLTGDKVLDDGADLLAHHTAGARCLVVECTTGSLNSGGKIGKLVKRVGELRSACPEIRVDGVLVASSPQKDLAKSERESAGAEGVSIVSAEGLSELLRMAERSSPIRDVLSFIDDARPRPEIGSLVHMARLI
jgi:hypothetical protein